MLDKIIQKVLTRSVLRVVLSLLVGLFIGLKAPAAVDITCKVAEIVNVKVENCKK